MIRIIEEDLEEKTTNFLLYDIKTHVVNSIRRIMMADYTNSAFNESNITVYKNTGLLHNEIVRHRLSLVPIKTTTGLSVSLNIKNIGNEIMTVYSDDLIIDEGEGEIQKGIILYKLKPNQEIELVAKSDVNTSKVGGVPYRPISTAFFKIIKQISISKKITGKKLKDIKEYLIDEHELFEEKKIYKKSETHKPIGLLHTVRDNTNFIEKTIEKFNLKYGDLKLEHLDYNNSPVYSFNIESFFIDPKEILHNSIKIFKEQLDNFLESEMEVEEEKDFIKLFVKNGTYTIANPLSRFLQENEKIKFAHYNKLHPLDDFLIIQITLHDMSEDYIAILQDTLEYINNYIEDLIKLTE